jgi:hypothetical protein
VWFGLYGIRAKGFVVSLHFFDQERVLVRRKLHAGRSLDEIRREVCDEDGFSDEQLFLLVIAAKIMGPTLKQQRVQAKGDSKP